MKKKTKMRYSNKSVTKSKWKFIAAASGVLVSLLFVAGLFSTLNVLQKFNYAFTQAQALSVSMNVQPAQTTLASNEAKTFTLNLNSNSRQITFVRGVVTFDTARLELTSEIDVSSSPLTQVIEKTSRTNANSSGRAVVVLALPAADRANPPVGTLLLANMSFRAKATTQTNVGTQISVDQNDVQVVDIQENDLTVNATGSNITINQSGNVTPAPTVRPTTQPTVRPSSAPTIRPSIRPTIRPSIRPTIRPSIRPTIRPTSPPSGGGGGGTGGIPNFPGGVNLSNLRQYCPLYRVYRGMAYRIYGSRYAQAFAYMDQICGR